MRFIPFFIILTFFAELQAQDFRALEGREDSAEFMLNEVSTPSKPASEGTGNKKPGTAIEFSKKAIDETEDIKAEKLPGETISGVVRLIRTSPQTEVFFKDLKNSYIIPKDSQHNKIYEACLQSSKTGKPVTLQVDPKSRRVLFQNTSTESKSGLGPASNSESSKGDK